ncbi:conserved hypothetical protein [Pediculus humanus corporis]|uniref:Uncharacterized protein n=1 Tax=Pediculus humanus subsp. corporis TaxID=121224 RepID=E0VUP9_PEDHC|nr:uncharacterized protein Phum_PHUM452860 [Pediculus humanus corporis]EEB17105.1 conserved hypothetical protein [Pediculus humanus corporis]
MSATTIYCDNFVGNAWKKDLCLNCFKSKEDHVIKNGFSQPVTPARIPDPPKEGILKRPNSKSSKSNKVIFLSTEFEVIGFGGDDSYSDDDCPDSCFAQAEEDGDDDVEETEEDKAFQKLTKTNTDYNSVPENLKEPKEGEIKKVVEPLKLGKQLFDDKGNKKTLLVSVTPFGDANGVVKNKINVNGVKSNVSLVNEIKTNSNANFDNNNKKKSESLKQSVVGPIVKTRHVDKKTEPSTVCNGENGDDDGAIFTSKKMENVHEVTNGDDSPNKVLSSDKSLKRSQPVDKSFKFRLIKDLQKENEKNFDSSNENNHVSKSEKIKSCDKMTNLIDKAKKKVNQLPAVVLDMYKIGESEDVKTNNEINDEKTLKGILVLPEIQNKFLSKEVKISATFADVSKDDPRHPVKNGFSEKDYGDERKTVNKDVVNAPNESIIDRNKLIPNVSSVHKYRLTNPILKREDENPESLFPNPVVKPLMNGVVSSLTSSPSACDKDFESPIVIKDERRRVLLGSSEKLNGDSEGGRGGDRHQVEMTTKSDEENSVTMEETVDKFQGEPVNGHVNGSTMDSSSSPPPPALPSKPPPSILESKSGFLNDSSFEDDGFIKAGGTEKPKVPAKPILIQSKKINFQSPIHAGIKVN